jgi:RNA recognition motif-containing protein
VDFHANDPTRDLFVGNFAYHLEDQDLFHLAVTYGPVLRARVVRDRTTGRSKGCGFVRYASPEDAKKAVKALDGLVFCNRVLRARPVNPPIQTTAKEGHAHGQNR